MLDNERWSGFTGTEHHYTSGALQNITEHHYTSGTLHNITEQLEEKPRAFSGLFRSFPAAAQDVCGGLTGTNTPCPAPPPAFTLLIASCIRMRACHRQPALGRPAAVPEWGGAGSSVGRRSVGPPGGLRGVSLPRASVMGGPAAPRAMEGGRGRVQLS